MSLQGHRPETLALYAHWRADVAIGIVAVPIYRTTSYQIRDTEHAANLFALEELANIYTRCIYPTDNVLEGGAAALALASGQASSAFALQNAARAADNIVSSPDLYVANIGDARSLAIHPATTTHSQPMPEEQEAVGVSDGYVRLSVGIEHVDDIIADIERDLLAAGQFAKAA